MKIVQGYEFDDDLELNDDAVFLLGHLKRRGVVYFEIDDSYDQQETVDQLIDASEEGYFRALQVGEHQWLLVEPEKFRVDLTVAT